MSVSVADVELARELRGAGGVLRVRAPDAANVTVANRRPSAQMELRVESAADEADTQTLSTHCVSALFMRS
jgi:hypothetical protein